MLSQNITKVEGIDVPHLPHLITPFGFRSSVVSETHRGGPLVQHPTYHDLRSTVGYIGDYVNQGLSVRWSGQWRHATAPV